MKSSRNPDFYKWRDFPFYETTMGEYEKEAELYRTAAEQGHADAKLIIKALT